LIQGNPGIKGVGGRIGIGGLIGFRGVRDVCVIGLGASGVGVVIVTGNIGVGVCGMHASSIPAAAKKDITFKNSLLENLRFMSASSYQIHA
jgi:hypothetical protein